MERLLSEKRKQLGAQYRWLGFCVAGSVKQKYKLKKFKLLLLVVLSCCYCCAFKMQDLQQVCDMNPLLVHTHPHREAYQVG